MKKILFALVAAAVLLVGCEPKPVLVTNITLSQTTGSIVEGESLHISAIVSPKEASNPTLTWSSSNNSVATVNASGDVTAIAPGDVKITASATDGSNVSASCDLTVVKKVILVTAIDLNEKTARIKAGESVQLTAVVSPTDATYQTVTWASDKTDVATVDATGKVTAVKAGTANITAAATDESGVKSAACVVTVYEPKPMFAKFQDMVIRQGQEYTNQAVWYGTVDAYADREDVPTSTWTSDNESIVAASTGSIKGVAAGKANVTIADPDGNKIVIPVEVLAPTNKDYDYNYGIELLSNKALYDSATGLGWNGNGTRYLGDGYADGTQCYHVKDLHREAADGTPKTVYLVSQAKFAPVDITAIEHPALYLRLYVSNVDVLRMDTAAAQIELSSNGADSEEYTWTGGRVFTNWEGQYGEPKFQLKNGWNNIVLPLEYAELSAGTPRPKAINWFRMYHNPAATYDMTGKDIEFAVDQLRIVDWTEFDTCDNFDQWFDGGTGNNRPCFRAAENKDGHAKVFGAVNDLITGPISNFRLKEWPGRVYSLPVNMDSQNAKFTWWFWVDDAAWFNKCHIKAELSSENVNDAHNWAWGKNPGELNLKNGWNEISYDFKDAEDQSGANTKRSDRKINYFRIVVTPMEGANSSVHTYYIDDLRVSKK